MERQIDEGYELIPMNEITDEARKIAVAWMECEDRGFILQKHKLASDIMNYARKQVAAALPVILDFVSENAKTKSELICPHCGAETGIDPALASLAGDADSIFCPACNEQIFITESDEDE